MSNNKLGISKTRVILLGFKGSGKSTVGKVLAEKLGFDFADIDTIMESKYEISNNIQKTVREIYQEYGADFFTKLETSAISQITNLKEIVIALGGRTPLNPMFDKSDFPLTIFIHLKVDADTLFGRIEKGGIPPFVDEANPKESITNLLNERTPYYEKLADATIDSATAMPGDIADSVIDAIKNEEAGIGGK